MDRAQQDNYLVESLIYTRSKQKLIEEVEERRIDFTRFRAMYLFSDLEVLSEVNSI